MTKKSSRVLGIVCAAVCLLSTLVYFNIAVRAGVERHVGVGCYPIETIEVIRKAFAGQFDILNLFVWLLSDLVRLLAAILLFVAVLGAGRVEPLLGVLPVALLVLDSVICQVFQGISYELFGYDDVWSFVWDSVMAMAPQLAIYGIALVLFAFAIISGKRTSALPLIAAFGLSVVALIMLVRGVSPFGYRHVGEDAVDDHYVAYVGCLARHVALWFGTAFACMAAAPDGAAANVSINSSEPVTDGAGGGAAMAGRASWGPAPSSPAQGGPRAFCPRCGAGIGVADKFCGGCGMPTDVSRGRVSRGRRQ